MNENEGATLHNCADRLQGLDRLLRNPEAYTAEKSDIVSTIRRIADISAPRSGTTSSPNARGAIVPGTRVIRRREVRVEVRKAA